MEFLPFPPVLTSPLTALLRAEGNHYPPSLQGKGARGLGSDKCTSSKQAAL